MTAESRKPLTGRRVFWWLFAFFAAVAAANLAMVFLGTASWTGLTDEKSYERGLHYNRILAEARQQDALGWHSSFAVTAADGHRRLAVRLTDSAGAALDGLILSGKAVRPTSDGADRELAFAATGGGVYVAELDLPLPGQWDLVVRAVHGDLIYRARHRLTLD